MAKLYLLNGWTNVVEVGLDVSQQSSSGRYPIVCQPGLTDITAWADSAYQSVGTPFLRVVAGTNSVEFGQLGIGSNVVKVVVESYQGQPVSIVASVDFAGQRGAPFYSGLNLGLAAAVACACVLYFLRAARSGSRSMITGGD